MDTRAKFTRTDVDSLSINLHNRYLTPSNKVAHAVIIQDDQGDKEILQYDIPTGSHGTPQFLPLLNIEEIEHEGRARYRAQTLDGISMFATRYIDGDVDGRPFQIACFSPKSDSQQEPNWGSDSVPALFRPQEDVSAEESTDDDHPVRVKGDRELTVEPASVRARTGMRRNPDQNEVMGESAKDAYDYFYRIWTDKLTPEMKAIFRRAIHAPLLELFQSQYRPEWVHAEPFSLTPTTIDPQRQDNLGAAPKWANNEMMVLSHIVKWFAYNCPTAIEKIKPHFRMLLDSELIEKINYEVSIEEQGHIVRLFQIINPLKQHPIFRKPTDLTQATAVVHAMVNDTPPASKMRLFKPVKRDISEVEGAEEKKDEKRAKIEPQ